MGINSVLSQESLRPRGDSQVDIAKVAEQAGYASVHDAFERVILEAYRLLQSGKVDQAEYLIVEGSNPPYLP